MLRVRCACVARMCCASTIMHAFVRHALRMAHIRLDCLGESLGHRRQPCHLRPSPIMCAHKRAYGGTSRPAPTHLAANTCLMTVVLPNTCLPNACLPPCPTHAYRVADLRWRCVRAWLARIKFLEQLPRRRRCRTAEHHALVDAAFYYSVATTD